MLCDLIFQIDAETNWQCTFVQLPGYIARYQRYLESYGVSNGDHVALVSLNCPEFILCHLAIASVGAVPVFVNPLATACIFFFKGSSKLFV